MNTIPFSDIFSCYCTFQLQNIHLVLFYNSYLFYCYSLLEEIKFSYYFLFFIISLNCLNILKRVDTKYLSSKSNVWTPKTLGDSVYSLFFSSFYISLC